MKIKAWAKNPLNSRIAKRYIFLVLLLLLFGAVVVMHGSAYDAKQYKQIATVYFLGEKNEKRKKKLHGTRKWIGHLSNNNSDQNSWNIQASKAMERNRIRISANNVQFEVILLKKNSRVFSSFFSFILSFFQCFSICSFFCVRHGYGRLWIVIFFPIFKQSGRVYAHQDQNAKF